MLLVAFYNIKFDARQDRTTQYIRCELAFRIHQVFVVVHVNVYLCFPTLPQLLNNLVIGMFKISAPKSARATIQQEPIIKWVLYVHYEDERCAIAEFCKLRTCKCGVG